MKSAHAEQAPECRQAAVPVIAVTRGRPTDADLAAVLAVMLSVRTAKAASHAAGLAPRTLWADRSRGWSALPHPGPLSWRASALPR